MKVKVIALSVAAILGAACTLHAASSSQSNDINQLQAPNINFEQIKQLTKQLEQRNTTAIASHKDVNTQINRQHSKFNAEGLTGEHVYIVRLQDSSVAVAARQTGSPIAASLQNINTQKVYSRGDATTRAVTTYRNQLLQKQRNVINEVAMATGQSKVRKQFTNALNGFSIKLTEEQANQIASLGSVASVMRSKHYDLLSDEGPKHIGADQVWNGTASPQGIAGQGEGQIIGIIDTGINSDHPSFADIGGDGFDHTNPWGNGNYVGDCVEEPEHIQCNDKLIGVRSYDVITDTYSEMIPGWPAIGEDYQGHGTHTAGTAAGNILYDVPYMTSGFAEQSDGIILKEDLFPQVSGVAPHANIIAYQVCHSTNDSGYAGCPGEALVAGIEDAITDGVDVINFSIGGADSNVWADPVQLAFLSAREAGISVAAAAGNSGTGECGDNWFFDDFSFGYSLLETQDYYLDISTRFNDDGFFFELDGIDKLFAVGPISESPTAPHYTPISLQPIKRDLSYLGGLAFGFQGVADIWFELATLQDITDVHNGHEIQFNAYRAMPLYQGMLALEAGINYKNDELIEYYYRVRKGEAISRLPQYDLQSSVNYHLKVNYEYPLSDDWSVDVKIKHTWLDSRLADSPMIDQSGYFSGFAGIKYTF